MIQEEVKIHDNYSVELKVGFGTSESERRGRFALNLWMFIPNSLDVNRFTYDKSHFYRDLKSNIRQITPVQTLEKVCEGDKSAYELLRASLAEFEANPDESNRHGFEFHVKMFQSIVKSALREEVKRIGMVDETQVGARCERLCESAEKVLLHYRQLGTLIEKPYLQKALLEYYRFGDEFMSNAVEYQLFRLMETLRDRDRNVFELWKGRLLQLITNENEYRRKAGYPVAEKDGVSDNHDLVNRLSLLKKYIESHLYLHVDKRKDGVLAEQLLFSLAAGLSMVFATAVAFSFQQRYGSFTMPLFVALVVSYMLKDRIKEMSRYYFAHKMGARYFDHKATMYVNEKEIGIARESIDFVSESKIPPTIVEARNCTTLIEAHNRAHSEKVLLYRLRMETDRDKLNSQSKFETSGVNTIIRFNFSEFTRNMDNPKFDLFVPDAAEGFEMIGGEKLYYINLIVDKQEADKQEAVRYRIAINRNGIKTVKKF